MIDKFKPNKLYFFIIDEIRENLLFITIMFCLKEKLIIFFKCLLFGEVLKFKLFLGEILE
jgi:hypothetical protein